jgi:uncharacterized protein YjiK
LRVFNRGTGKWAEFAVKGAEFPAWSPDGRSIYVLRENDAPGIYRVEVSDGAIERIADLKGYRLAGTSDSWMDVDASGAPMLLRDLDTDDIYALAFDGK